MADQDTVENGIRLGPREVSDAAAEVLASSGRHRSGRPPLAGDSPAERERRRRANLAATINVNAAKRSAAALAKESASYRKLVEMQQRIDLFLMRKQQDIKDALKNHVYSVPRTFRLYLFNTYRGQDSTTNDKAEGEDGKNAMEIDNVPSWTLRMQGKLLPQPSDISATAEGTNLSSDKQDNEYSSAKFDQIPGAVSEGVGMSSARPQAGGILPSRISEIDSKVKCSHVFKRVVFELDKELYPNNNLIEWNRNKGEADCDGFEITRPGSREHLVKIYLFVDHRPEQFKLSNELSELLGIKQDTRSGIFTAIWQHIKKEKLQCVDNRTFIRLDSSLRGLMTAEQASRGVIKLQILYQIVKLHMAPADPLQLEFDVKLSGDPTSSQACYDIQVQLEDTALIQSAKDTGVFGDSQPSTPEFQALHAKHLEALEQLAFHKRRRDFFECFSAGPVDFINQLIMSQTRDLKVIGGATGRNPEEERRALFYHQQWIHEAIPRYLLRKAISDAAKKTAQTAPK